MAGGGATVEMPRRPLGSLAPFSLDKSGRIKVSRVEESRDDRSPIRGDDGGSAFITAFLREREREREICCGSVFIIGIFKME